jgi:hypothetical protein
VGIIRNRQRTHGDLHFKILIEGNALSKERFGELADEDMYSIHRGILW